MTSLQIPTSMLEHLQYLRNLHLQGPRLGNIYLQDTALLEYLQTTPLSHNKKFQTQLQRLGDRFSNQYLVAARNAQQNQPRLQQFDSFGKRIDKLHLSQGWKTLGKYCAEDGIVSLAYEQDKYDLKQYQRFGQLVVLYLFNASSGLYGCPLAMTDGAAYTLRDSKDSQLQQAYRKLIARKQNWTSGQWMTQKKGGSDVSNTQTLAIKNNKGLYNLYGYKWFTSATQSQMSLGLGKIIKSSQKPNQKQLINTKVSLFFIKVHQQGILNNLEIIRLKDKLGTQQLPTAELLLKGTQAKLVGQQGNGVKTISKMLTVTRIYNSATAVSVIRRVVALTRDYSSRRTISKSKLNQMPLQLRVLSNLQITHRANLIFYLSICNLFTKEHSKTIGQDQANLLRVFTPILKLFTGKQAVQVASQGLQCFGGMGYIEGTMLPSLLRDAQVLTIWQGTTNVLCYDFVRALIKQENSIKPFTSLVKFFTQVFEQISAGQVQDKTFIQSNKQIVVNYLDILRQLQGGLKDNFRSRVAQLRNICFGLAKIYISALLQLRALKTMRKMDIQISNRWAKRGLLTLQKYDKNLDKKIGLDLNEINEPRGVNNIDIRGKIRCSL